MASVASRASGVPGGGEGDHHGIVFTRQLRQFNLAFGAASMRNQYHHVILTAIHTAHALQHNVIGINNRYVKAEEFIHGVVRHGRRRAKTEERNSLAPGD